ncbi:FkbM family methyltransferase [Pseudoalteromonas rubra]|uniref:Methyltransferase FkbM domain-containing protein n=1 Tax=Pseudoalteromonas rubra TaxID=43658 RepID=A0A5S3WWM1_9GAMM|nr:FkbM family methyltransferase [Pseudoalteromonas rubra]TMP33860.1 hypothetical protein CWB98_18930 [Pseudoalteromonas rubra]
MEYIIYGAGGNGRVIHDAIIENGDQVLFFLDLYTSEKFYRDTPIYKPEEISPSDDTVLVSISCFSQQVKSQLVEKGYNKCLNLNEVMTEYSYIFDAFFDLSTKKTLINSEKEDSDKLDWLESKLTSEQSKQCLRKIRQFRRNPSNATYLENDFRTQYFPTELLEKGLVKTPLRMVDCGAFSGDTLQLATEVTRNHDIEFDSIVCFEPDVNNFEKLQARIKQSNAHYPRTITLLSGVWSESTTLHFSSQGDQSKVCDASASNTNMMTVSKIDDVCYGIKPNFIKMDVEGAEIEALKGSSKIIADFQPNLAISVYHHPEHLWQIAELIEQLHQDYSFHLYAHGDFCNEIVLYAIAKQSNPL